MLINFGDIVCNAMCGVHAIPFLSHEVHVHILNFSQKKAYRNSYINSKFKVKLPWTGM